jgi:HAD superfamily hydrolase (TIGR01549 family)
MLKACVTPSNDHGRSNVKRLTAVIWDFDGTLVDTRDKNLAVTRVLVERVTGQSANEIPALVDRVGYEAALHRHQHWQDFYRRELGLGEEELVAAAGMWMEAQANDHTDAPCFAGVPGILERLDHLPHGIVSLNARDNITRIIGELELDTYFDEVLGFEAVPFERRKPAPDALLLCIERLEARRPGTVVYIGDHETDTLCAARAQRELHGEGHPTRVVSVAATFGCGSKVDRWSTQPDFTASTAAELEAILSALDAG